MILRRSVLQICVVLACAQPVLATTDAPWSAPATVAISSEPIVFENEGAVLHGTVYMPKGAKNVPAFVVFHGASEPLASTPLYEHLREGLPRLGIAVLIFDRRGTGASTGRPNVPYATLAGDGIAGANAIRKLPNVDPKRVGYWGISQGGWLATFAASRDPQAAFAVAVSAPLVSPEVQMEFAMSNQLAVLGYGKEDVDEMLRARRELDGFFNERNPRADAVAALRAIQDKAWFKFMYLPKADAVPENPNDSVWRTQMDLDPSAAVLQVKIPMLFILGDSDPWIPVSRTVDALQAVSKKNPHLQFVVVPHANHLMMTPPAREQMTDAASAEVAVEKPQAVAYFQLLSAWLQRNGLVSTP